jgi:protein-disulfide isomerase
MILLKTKLALLIFFMAAQVSAQDQIKNQNSGNHTVQSGKVRNMTTHIEDCNGSLSTRLELFKKWLMTFNVSDTMLIKGVMERKETMTDTKLFLIDTAGVIFEGFHSAPIWIIAYVSATCPSCKRLYKELYDSITIGSLAGIARIGIKPVSENQTNMALVAAGKWHKQAALMNALAPVKDRITIEIITRIMDSLKVPLNEFANACKDKALITYVQKSYLEATYNGASVTPAFFINGHRYYSCNDTRWIIDAIEYRNHCGHLPVQSR